MRKTHSSVVCCPPLRNERTGKLGAGEMRKGADERLRILEGLQGQREKQAQVKIRQGGEYRTKSIEEERSMYGA